MLVDAPGQARSFREAPEIDGMIAVPSDLPVGEFATVEVTDALGPDLVAAHRDAHRGVRRERARAGAPHRRGRRRYGPSAIATPANFLTVIRLLVAPVLFAMIFDQVSTWPNVILWTILVATDGVDGIIARRHGTTRSGAFLDPLADKVLILGALFALVAADALPLLPVAIIAVREIGISLYRVQLGRQGLAVPARLTAKIKTFLQSLAVGAVLLPWTARRTSGSPTRCCGRRCSWRCSAGSSTCATGAEPPPRCRATDLGRPLGSARAL